MYKELYHHGILGQRWGKRNGPPYPLGAEDHSQHEKKAGWRKSLSKSEPQTTKKTHKERKGLSDHQKTTIKVGVGLVAAALVAYGGYKLYKSGVGQDLVSKALRKGVKNSAGESKDLSDSEGIKGLSDDEWIKGLADGEVSAIRQYTNAWYHHGNRALRGSPKATLSELDRKIIKNLDSAIDKYELKKETTFTRYGSAKLLGGADTKWAIEKMVGNVIHDDGYASTTTGSEKIKTWFGTPDKITYLIKTPPGKGIGAYVADVSVNPEENEFLFARGSDFEITGVREDVGRLVVELLCKGATRSDI